MTELGAASLKGMDFVGLLVSAMTSVLDDTPKLALRTTYLVKCRRGFSTYSPEVPESRAMLS
jgi:hypothetical protein